MMNSRQIQEKLQEQHPTVDVHSSDHSSLTLDIQEELPYNVVNNLPSAIFYNKILPYLPLIDIKRLSLINKEHNTIITPIFEEENEKIPDQNKLNMFWKDRIKKHFPQAFDRIRNQKSLNWQLLFWETYRSQYVGLTENQKKLFLAAKDSDTKHFLTNLREIQELFLLDNTGQPLVDILAASHCDALREIGYCAMIKKSSAINSDKLILLEISFKRPIEKIEALLAQYALTPATNLETLVSKETPLHIAAAHGYNALLIKWLAQAPQTLEITEMNHQTPLAYAVNYGQLSTVNVLIAHHANINPPPIRDSGTLLYQAIKYGYIEIALYLIEKGAILTIDPESTNLTQQPIHLAAQLGDLELIKAMIRKSKTLLNPLDLTTLCDNTNYKRTALLYAIENNHPDVVDYLRQQPNLNDQIRSYLECPRLESSVACPIYYAQMLTDIIGQLDMDIDDKKNLLKKFIQNTDGLYQASHMRQTFEQYLTTLTESFYRVPHSFRLETQQLAANLTNNQHFSNLIFSMEKICQFEISDDDKLAALKQFIAHYYHDNPMNFIRIVRELYHLNNIQPIEKIFITRQIIQKFQDVESFKKIKIINQSIQKLNRLIATCLRHDRLKHKLIALRNSLLIQKDLLIRFAFNQGELHHDNNGLTFKLPQNCIAYTQISHLSELLDHGIDGINRDKIKKFHSQMNRFKKIRKTGLIFMWILTCTSLLTFLPFFPILIAIHISPPVCLLILMATITLSLVTTKMDNRFRRYGTLFSKRSETELWIDSSTASLCEQLRPLLG